LFNQGFEGDSMMKVWVMQGSYEGELFSSVHLTQKGCALACISDITEFHGIDDDETALSVINNTYHGDSEEATEHQTQVVG
jgi:hypothetical protein